jgi:hypothetical protein
MSHPQPGRTAPLLASLLAGAGLVSMVFAPAWLPAVAVAVVALLGGAAVARRRSRGLAAAVAAVAASLALGLAGAWLLRDRATVGLAWTLLVIFAIPLPLVPWLYWLTFKTGGWGQGTGDRAGPCPLSPVPREEGGP